MCSNDQVALHSPCTESHNIESRECCTHIAAIGKNLYEITLSTEKKEHSLTTTTTTSTKPYNEIDEQVR